ncbi:MAG: amidohydrolase family protein, partial [Actinobacteria bacterium]|nr:amidohydrolase family protein [Actinomycetota bacterium]
MPAPADLVITGADVYTVDAARSWSDAVAVRDGIVVGTGDEAVRDLTGPHTERLHLPGQLVLPGFQDAHVHVPFAGRDRLHVDLHDLAGRPAYLDHIAAYATSRPDVPWIIGGGWAMEHFPGGTPRKEDLDAIVPDRPVFLFNRDVHGAWANSAALAIAGITRDTPDPSDGRIERDPVTGEPTGTLHEGAAYTFDERHVPKPDRTEWEAAIANAQSHLHSLGITGWQDAWVSPETLDAYRSMAGADTL